jgi:hypothetical protein
MAPKMVLNEIVKAINFIKQATTLLTQHMWSEYHGKTLYDTQGALKVTHNMFFTSQT